MRNLHRLAGTLERLQKEALEGPCAVHADRPSVGFIQGWDLHPKGCCQACADYGEPHGYVIHREAGGIAPTEKESDQ